MSSTQGRLLLATLFAFVSAASAQEAAPPRPRSPTPPQATTPPAPRVPAGALCRVGSTSLSHGGYAVIVAYAPDGKTIASGGNDRLVRLWDVATGDEIRRFAGHGSNVDTVAFTADGKTLASGSVDNTIRLWDVASGKQKAVLPNAGGGINCVVFSPDGKTLASKGHDGALRLWDLATSKEVHRLPSGSDSGTSNVVFTPDGKHVAAVDEENALRLWDAATGNEVRKFVGHRENVHSLDVSRDGKWLASASMDRTVRLWEIASGKEMRQFLGHTDLASAVRISPDGKTLASCAADKTIRLWDAATGKEIRQMLGHVALVSEVSFSPDGKTLASASWDHTIRLWDVATGKELPQSRRDGGPLVCAVLSADGKTLAAGHRDGGVRLWDAGTGKPLREVVHESSAVVAVALSPAGDLLAARTLDGAVNLYETATGKPRHALVPTTPRAGGALSSPPAADNAASLAFSPDGKLLAAVDAAGAVTVWDADTGKDKAVPFKSERGVYRVAFSPDGRLLGGACRDSSVRLCGTATWQEVRQLGEPGNRVAASSLAFAPDGRTLLAESPGGPRVWELATGQLRSRADRGQELFGAYAASGAAATAAGQVVRLWSPLLGKDVRTLRGHGAVLSSLSFSGDGRRLATVGGDGTAVVWDVAFLAKEARPAAMALTPAQLDAHWDALAGADAAKAGEAVAALVASGSQAAVIARERLKWGGSADPKRIDKLVAELDDDDFNVREQASRELERLAGQAEAALRKALAAEPSAEATRRVSELLKKVEGGAASGDKLRALRALEVLENVGDAEARKTLRELAKGPAADFLTQEAKSVLERLAKRPGN